MLIEKFFLYLLRSSGVFLLYISGMLEMQMKDELKSYLPVFLFKDALDYARYLSLVCFLPLVGNYFVNNNFLIFSPKFRDLFSLSFF